MRFERAALEVGGPESSGELRSSCGSGSYPTATKAVETYERLKGSNRVGALRVGDGRTRLPSCPAAAVRVRALSLDGGGGGRGLCRGARERQVSGLYQHVQGRLRARAPLGSMRLRGASAVGELPITSVEADAIAQQPADALGQGHREELLGVELVLPTSIVDNDAIGPVVRHRSSTSARVRSTASTTS